MQPNSEILFRQEFEIQGGDFINGGEASCDISNRLKEVGVNPDIILRVAVVAYEAEMNVVMYARRGTMRIAITEDQILLTVEDVGQGIKDTELAMKPGYSTATKEMREMGFGAGMGLPNIKKNADFFSITSTVGKGTKIEMTIYLDGDRA